MLPHSSADERTERGERSRAVFFEENPYLVKFVCVCQRLQNRTRELRLKHCVLSDLNTQPASETKEIILIRLSFHALSVSQADSGLVLSFLCALLARLHVAQLIITSPK